MNLVRRNQKDLAWRPFNGFETLQNEIERLFDFPFSRWPRTTDLFEGGWGPAIDMYDEKDNLIVKADLPGFTKEEIEVTVEDGALILKGEKKHEEKSKDKGSIREERFYGSFYRAIALPVGVDADKVQAIYKNGVVELTLPKKEEAKPKKITVEIK